MRGNSHVRFLGGGRRQHRPAYPETPSGWPTCCATGCCAPASSRPAATRPARPDAPAHQPGAGARRGRQPAAESAGMGQPQAGRGGDRRQGRSARAMLAAIVAGEEDAPLLAELARGRMRAKRAGAGAGADGARARPPPLPARRSTWRIWTSWTSAWRRWRGTLRQMMSSLPVAFEEAAQRLDTIPGIRPAAGGADRGRGIGVDLSRFPSEKHLKRGQA